MDIVNFRDAGCELDYQECERYKQKHKVRILRELEKFSLEELAEINWELSNWKWNKEKLGPYKGALEGRAYRSLIAGRIGRYESLRRYHLVCLKETEEEFKDWMLKEMVDLLFPY